MFVGKAWRLHWSTREALALLVNIRLGWKALPKNKHPSLLQTFITYGRKNIHNNGPRPNAQISDKLEKKSCQGQTH